MKRCKIQGCRKRYYGKGYCKLHWFQNIGKKLRKDKITYYANFLKRDTINAKEGLFFKSVWQKLNQQENVIKHRKSVVERILLKQNTNTGGST